MTDGKRANRTGRNAEDAIGQLITSIDGASFERHVNLGLSIYGSTICADYVVKLPRYPTGLVIESRWQASRGTVEKQLPFIYLNILAGGYIHPVVIVVAGGGHSNGALTWIRSKVDGQRLIAAVNFDQLVALIGEWKS